MWHGGLAAWARATFQYHVNGTDTVGRLVGRSVDRPVGRSVDARAPVDHDSVGLAQARPNKEHNTLRIKPLNPIVHFWLHHTAHCAEKIVCALARWFCVSRKGGTGGGGWGHR